MIRCFPDPYPDELLYSICARFSDRVRYSRDYFTTLDLFGSGHCRAVTDLPSHLAKLGDRLPQKDYYTIDNLIDNHTLLAFYTPFMTEFRAKRLRLYMEEGNRGHVPLSFTKRLFCGVHLQGRLRFCPLCLEDDRREVGECYWHRNHQIPGVEVCVKHNVYLQNSSVLTQQAKPVYKFFSAKESAMAELPIELDLSKPFDEILLQIAYNASWLMRQKSLSLSFESSRYKDFLYDRGWVHDDGVVVSIDQHKLLNEFEERYDSNTMQYFNSEFDEKLGRIWPFKFVFNEEGYHPIHHLLFIHFLGFKIEDFFHACSN